ncbi:hypothetical protein HS7_14790 [Sulfolobales archaeon HS-7]|nr:hypothetical protein HS7_14790 [Sulfolobales archaeon HS-7]
MKVVEVNLGSRMNFLLFELMIYEASELIKG